MKDSSAIYRERLGVFQSDIASLTLADVRPLPDLTRIINHAGKEPSKIDLEPAFYLNAKTYQYISNRNKDSTIKMVPDDAQKVTREDSRHQVFLGYLDFVEQGIVQYESNVAVKSQKAEIKELAWYQLLGAVGISSFKPFGFIVMPNGNQHLLTKVRRSVKTIDSIDWSLLTPDEMWETAKAGTETMILWHKHLFFQGDLEFRNVATDDFSKPVATDPEYSTSLQDVGDELLHLIDDPKAMLIPEVQTCFNAIARKMGVDFTALSASTKAFIFPHLPHSEYPRDSAAVFKLLKMHYYDPYSKAILDDPSKYQKVLLLAYDVFFRKRVSEALKGII